MSLQGKNIVITGATAGLGAAAASVLSKEGASVFIGGRRADQGKEISSEMGVTFHVVDVADEESNKAFFAAAEKHFGGQNVDYILLNAGVEGDSEKTTINNLDVATFDFIYNVNVRGVFLGLKHGEPLLRKGGTFLFTSSGVSILPLAGNPVYGSSKAAVDSLARSYAAQFAQSEDERIKSLSVVTINPGFYYTEMGDRFTGYNKQAQENLAKWLNPSQRGGTPSELASVVLDFVRGGLPYKNGDSFFADADTHFPLSEYDDRIKMATAAK